MRYLLSVFLFGVSFVVGFGAVKAVDHLLIASLDVVDVPTDERIFGDIDSQIESSPSLKNIAIHLGSNDFFMLGRGCGNGFASSYLTKSRVVVYHGFSPDRNGRTAREFMDIERGQAIEVIEDIYPVETAWGLVHFLLTKQKGITRDFYEILLTKPKLEGFYYFEAPDLETLMSFEKYIQNEKMRAIERQSDKQRNN